MLAVIIEYQKKPGVDDAFAAALTAMLARVETIDGYLGEIATRSIHDETRFVTISYWRDAEALKAWRDDPEHRKVMAQGRTEWLAWYRIKVLRLDREYGAGEQPAAAVG